MMPARSFNLKVGDSPAPDMLFKQQVVEVYRKAVDLSIEGNKAGYCEAVKALWRMLVDNLNDKQVLEIETQYAQLKMELYDIHNGSGRYKDMTEAQRDAEMLTIKYRFFDGLMVYVSYALQHSNIMPRNTEGIIDADDMPALKRLASAIRQQTNIQDTHETEDYEGEIADGASV